ncbi:MULTISPECIES: ATP-dependent endonuclease [unclassified Pseudomonas]|uniref:ATP-dependent nuclease n=1 Tax=unclassified Pseudomonas TaxID=196821 RepID=UPI000A1F429C|nr:MULTISPECIES: ATP-binding protein [unclassified Pseudomonas]
MDVKFVGYKAFKGFELKEAFSIKTPVSVLIGKNGCGKTRLFESIKSGDVEVVSDPDISRDEIFFVSHGALVPKLESRYVLSEVSARKKSLLDRFRLNKPEFDRELDTYRIETPSLRFGANDIGYKEAHRIIRSIAEKLSKKPSQLSDDEISNHYDGYEVQLFGSKNITAIFTRYIERLHDNEYAMWLSDVRGKVTYHVSDDEFEAVYGRQPWVVLNEILDKTFNGKVTVGIPGASEAGDEYIACFYEGETGAPIKESDLSSGEQALLWLALVTFATQFSATNSDAVPKILLMDEPDAFLHPSMVVQLISFLDSFSREFSAKILITTHSPTTVALSPDDSLYALSDGVVSAVDKDLAISTLLEGVTQISVNPFNRRLVLVESFYDAEIYQSVYRAIPHGSSFLDSRIALTFVSSGPKMPPQQISDKLNQVFGKAIQKDKIDEFLNLVNGMGNCEQVKGMVEALSSEGDRTVRGLIDWDRKNTAGKNVVVLGEGSAYSLENIALDPICIMLLLHLECIGKYPISEYCGADVGWGEWLRTPEHLQESMNWFVCKLFKRPSANDVQVEYISGVSLKGDKEYLQMRGHDLAELIISEFDELRGLIKNKVERLMGLIVNKSMLKLSEGKFIPNFFCDAFRKLQVQIESGALD